MTPHQVAVRVVADVLHEWPGLMGLPDERPVAEAAIAALAGSDEFRAALAAAAKAALEEAVCAPPLPSLPCDLPHLHGSRLTLDAILAALAPEPT